MMPYDSIIFDMDGTLWDAVDSYCKVWNETFKQMGVQTITISRQELLRCMGLPINEIFARIVKISINSNIFLEKLSKNEALMMPTLGGTLYPGVFDGIKLLSKHYRLFMVSNCGAEGLKNFLSFTQLSPYIEDTLTHGETLLNKTENIKRLINRHNLTSPIYMGDTQGDCNYAHAANIPMIYASYGFGKCNDAEYTVNSFNQFVELFLSN